MKFHWKPDPDDPDGVVSSIRHGEGDVVLRVNPYRWEGIVCGVRAREVILTDEMIRRDARMREGGARRPREVARSMAERWCEDLIKAAEAEP